MFNKQWRRSTIGGLWEEVGKLQFNFLVSQGLKPEHYFLDIGCGSLRGGIHFIKYLNKGNYFGIDKNSEILKSGLKELKENGLSDKNCTLKHLENFELETLEQKFDFVLAQSVFTHLPLNNIIRCIMKVDQTLNVGGRFYATIFENQKGKFNLDPVPQPRTDGKPASYTFFDKNSFHYDFETFQWICTKTNLVPEYIGDWNHPRNQKMIMFTKK